MKKEKPVIASRYRIYGAFALGLMTAISFRAIIIFNRIQPAWVRPTWYLGVLGNFIFFLYRYQITEKRKMAVNNYQLIDKIESGLSLAEEDRNVLVYLLSSIKRSPENINYLIISVFSLIAIASDIVLSVFE